MLNKVETEADLQEWQDLGATYPILGDFSQTTHGDWDITDTPELLVIRDDDTIVYRGSNTGGHYQAEQVVLALLE